MRVGTKFLTKAGLTAALAMFALAPAAHATTYDYTGSLTPGGTTILTIDVTIGAAAPNTTGGYYITGVTGELNGIGVSLAGTASDPPQYLTSFDGEWYYDNILYPTNTSPYATVFDNPGLLLQKVGGDFVNIFSPGYTTAALYDLGQSPGQQQQDLYLTFAGLGGGALATPLPSTWTMLIAGFIGLGYFAYRGKRDRSVSLSAA